MRMRRYRPRPRNSSRRSWISLTPRPPWVRSGGLAARRISGWLALLPHPQLRGGIPEVGLVLTRDQLLHRSLGRIAIEPAGTVVGARVRPVVLLPGDVQPELF